MNIVSRGFKKIRRIVQLKIDYHYGIKIIERNSRAFPDFLIIGAAKSGTTSLFQYLSQHPKILPPKKKEVRYLASGSLEKYLNHFPNKLEANGKLTFEATPTYLYLTNVAKNFKKFQPNLKMI